MTADHAAEKDAGFRRWIPDDQHGYSIALCGCEGGPYLGARKMGTPCCCERCGFMTWDQYRFLRDAITGVEPEPDEHYDPDWQDPITRPTSPASTQEGADQ